MPLNEASKNSQILRVNSEVRDRSAPKRAAVNEKVLLTSYQLDSDVSRYHSSNSGASERRSKIEGEIIESAMSTSLFSI